MTLFSQRKGIRPVRKAIQREQADQELRDRLWNALTIMVWGKFDPSVLAEFGSNNRKIQRLSNRIWHDYFKEPLDAMPRFDPAYSRSCYHVFRERFFTCEWWETYDILEFILKACPQEWANSLRTCANQVLESENAAYRIVGNAICDISDQHEIDAIEEALAAPLAPARWHIQRSLELLSDKQNPDYPNSVKEAVSALESAAQEVAGRESATLGDCIKVMERSGGLHPAFKEGLSKLYGYTSDSGGIRHALTETDRPPTYSEAKFMLVACAAFINLLAGKRAEAPQ